VEKRVEEKQSKKFTSIALLIVAVFTLLAFIALFIYSNFEERESNEMQNKYHSEIKNIENYLNEGNCTQASLEYDQAKITRHNVDKRGLYYSFNSPAAEGHSLEIAECFAKNKEFSTAVSILDREGGRGPDYLLRASVIYKNAGEIEKAQAAKAKAKNY
jgi:tetratricopeptide (TPR) repeat protein